MRALLPLLSMTLICSLAVADDKDKLPPINPDRPDFTNGIGIVPMGHILVEFGYRQTRSQGFTLHQYGDSQTLRIPVSAKFEVEAGLNSYDVLRSDSGNANGLEDSAIGFKWVVHDGKDKSGFKDPGIAVQVGTSLPTGADAFRSSRMQPHVQSNIAFFLDDNNELDVDLGLAVLNDNGASFSQFFASASWGHAITERVGSFLELYSLLPGVRSGPNDSFADTGLTYRLTNDLQLDMFGGIQVDKHRQQAFFGFGASVRF